MRLLTHPLLEKIRQFQDKSYSGSVFLHWEEEVVRLFFREGLIDAISSNLDQHRLGQYLLGEGILDSKKLETLLASSRRKQMSLGESAVRRKLLDVTELGELIRRQAFQLFKHAMEKDFNVEAVEASLRFFYMPVRLDVESLALELARSKPGTFELPPDLLVHLRNGRGFSHLPWYPREISVLGHLKSPRTLHNLASETGFEPNHLLKILDVFDALEMIEILPTPDVDGQKDGEASAVAWRDGFFLEHFVPQVRSPAVSDKLELFKEETSFVGEQFKTLKVFLRGVQSERRVKVITISSPDTQDGKSLVTANLALCFSKDPGQRVIVVDCDLRNPTLDKLFGIPLEPGLTAYLESVQLRPYCYMRRLQNLYLMTAGGLPSNPVEMLSLRKMEELMDYLRGEFDTVIIDSPPYASIPDARVLTKLADALVMIVRRRKTTCGSIEQALSVSDRKKLVGFVFNDVKPMLFHTRYNNNYYHYGSNRPYPHTSLRKVRSRPKTYCDS